MLTMKLRQEINNTRDMIDGDLNRIMITDDIEEIRRLTYYLFLDINDLIRKNQQRIAKSLRCEESESDINEWKERTMLEGMNKLMQKISKNLDIKTFTVLELIEMSNDVYFDIMENYCDDSID